MVRKLSMLVAALALVASLGTPAHAVLSALGPINPVDGFPTYVQDTNGLILTECTIGDGVTGPCVFAPVDPLNPFSVSIGFGIEMFYYFMRWPNFVSPTNLVLIGVEASFLPTIAPGNQTLFQRIRWTQDAPVAGTYTLNHPYGTVSVNVTTPGAKAIKFTADTIGLPPTFTTALAGPIGPFCQAVSPAPPVGFIGSPLINQTFTGSPIGRNSITIIQPGGTVYATTNAIQLSGHIGTATTPTPLAVSRATYGKDLAPSTAGQLDVFAQAPTTAAVAIAANALTGVPSAPMAGDGLGNFFGHAVLTNASAFPGTLINPTVVNVTADNSVALPSQTPTTLAVTPVDNVTVTSATYDVLTNTLAVSATSSDKSSTSPVLTLTVPAIPAPGNVMTTDPVTKVATISAVLPIAPPFVTVQSATGGNSGSDNVIVTRGGAAGSPAPVAVNDAATVKLPALPAVQQASVVIPLLFNDTPGTTGALLDPASVVTTQGLHGVVSAPNPLDGSVTYTTNLPAPGAAAFTGVDQFTYTMKDKAVPPNTSNTATVVVTIQPGLAAVIAGNDIANVPFNTATLINVAANDTTSNVGATVDPLSVAIVTPPLHGTLLAPTATGITYTPTVGYTGADSFVYNIKDTLGALSNNASVSITVAAGPPVAVNDTAFSTGVATPINVLANDTAPGSTLNPATVTIVTAPLHGTATVNTVTGVVTYTPVGGFGGTDSFNYRVSNAAGVASNIATVTVGVEAIKLGSAQYTTLLRSWAISGNSTVHTGETMTFYVGSTTAGTVIGTAPVGLNGNFTFSVTGSAVSPGTATTISCKSSTGGQVLGFPLQIR